MNSDQEHRIGQFQPRIVYRKQCRLIFEENYTLKDRIFFTQDFVDFFKELAANNHKEWFDVHRKRYENTVKEPFKDFVQHLIVEFAKTNSEFSDLEAKDCIFRINRDIRFSADKTPYKLYTSAVISPGGKKSRSLSGVYVELTPEHVRVYGGVYEPDKDEVYDIRSHIASNPDEFSSLTQVSEFKKLFGEIRGEKNKILPPEFKQAAVKQPLIFNKQWYFFAEFTPDHIALPGLDQLVISCYKTALPVSSFLLKSIN
ncbi:MAG: hypothetical protein RIT43_1035 [Bacteroidota bacterium]